MSISHISNLRQPITAKPPKSTKDSAKDSASTNWTYDFERMGEPSHFVRRRTSSAHCGIDFTKEFDGSDVVFKVKPYVIMFYYISIANNILKPCNKIYPYSVA